MEDMRSGQYRAETILKATTDELNVYKRDMKFMSRKYIAFLIFRGWTKLRTEQSQALIRANAKEIRRQRVVLDANQEQLDLMTKYKVKAEAQMADYRTKIEELEVANADHVQRIE